MNPGGESTRARGRACRSGVAEFGPWVGLLDVAEDGGAMDSEHLGQAIDAVAHGVSGQELVNFVRSESVLLLARSDRHRNRHVVTRWGGEALEGHLYLGLREWTDYLHLRGLEPPTLSSDLSSELAQTASDRPIRDRPNGVHHP